MPDTQPQSSAIIGLIGEPGSFADLHVLTETALEKARLAMTLAARRRAGELIRVYSNDEALLEALCDELWWVRDGAIERRGAPAEVLGAYRRWVAAQLAQSPPAPLTPAFRRGDGRAALESIQALDAGGHAVMAWESGAPVAIRVRVRFAAPVDDPVVGIMIRTRIGMEVYGTNTQLEQVKLGPVPAGGVRTVTFSFPCRLCPQEYTITAASHDPDGVWHDWMEDALAVMVTGTRYTAGVANLGATVTVETGA